jgi:hypothetical protein
MTESEPITQGDKYEIPFKVNGDLTGATTTLRVKRGRVSTALTHTVTDAAAGEGVITDTSALPSGSYRASLRAVNGDQKVTYRLKGYVTVEDGLD